MSTKITSSLIDYIRTPIKYFQDTYKHYVHVEKEGNFPILERFIAYGIPTAAALGLGFNYSSEEHIDKVKAYNLIVQIPGAIAGYLVSQLAVTYSKPHVESMDKGIFKSVANFGVKTLDNLNNLVLYVPAYNLLPENNEFNTAFAFYVLPAMVKGVESDFSSWWNGKDYESEVAGRVYAEVIAGGVAANLSTMTEGHLKSPAKDKLEDKKAISEYIGKNTQAKIIAAGVDTVSYALIKKLLVGQKYESDELKNDFARTFFKDALKATNFISDLEAKSVEGSIFKNGVYIKLIKKLLNH